MLLGAAVLLVVPMLVLVFWPKHEGRWPIADEMLLVDAITVSKRKLSFFVPLNLQPSNSVLRAEPVHYLRPYQLQRLVGNEWVTVPVGKRLYWAELNSRNGLQRCLCRFLFQPTTGEYRALMVYRFRGRWDFFRRRLANRLPQFLGRKVLQQKADGAVWTTPFTVTMEPDSEEGFAEGTTITEDDFDLSNEGK